MMVWIEVSCSPMNPATPTEAGCRDLSNTKVTAKTYSFQALKKAITAAAAIAGAISGRMMRARTAWASSS